MKKFTDEDFYEFIRSFNKKNFKDEYHNIHKCYDSLSILSKSDSPPYNSLIVNSQEMYGLDWMVKSSDKWSDTSQKCIRNPKLCNHKYPNSVDALHFKKNNENKFELHIIEFKFIPNKDNKSKLNKLYSKIIEIDNRYKTSKSNSYSSPDKRCFNQDFIDDFKDDFDEIENSLQLKPYEAIFIVLPGLYDEYCRKYGEVKKDIRGYLANMDKYYWVCIDGGTQSETNLHYQASSLEKYFKRMVPDVFVKACARTKKEFELDLKETILG